MKNINVGLVKFFFHLGLIIFLFSGCKRELSPDIAFATNPTTAYVFNDAPVGLGTNFYFPYAAGPDNPIGSKLNAWSVDNSVSYLGTSSMRIDVPNGNDPSGNYAGAILRVDGEGSGRDLTGYDALTFWAKGSLAVNAGQIGFGEDFGLNKYQATMQNLILSTSWTKYIIPIPDPSKLTRERGMLRYAFASAGADKTGYAVWIDELKFEKVGTLAIPKPAIYNGTDNTQSAFNGSVFTISDLSQTFNLGNGINQTVVAAPSYFIFNTSNPLVARVSELGVVTVVGAGTAKITATLNGVLAKGSLSITSAGVFPVAPAKSPLPLASNVIAVFSDQFAYNVPVDTYNGNFGGSTTQTNLLTIGTEKVLYNSNVNYAGIQFQNPTIDATNMTFLHLDIYPNSTTTAPNLSFSIRDRGSNGVLETNTFTGGATGDDKQLDYAIPANQLVAGQWYSVDIPLNGAITSQKNNLAQITFSGNINFYLDNIYFYKP